MTCLQDVWVENTITQQHTAVFMKTAHARRMEEGLFAGSATLVTLVFSFLLTF